MLATPEGLTAASRDTSDTAKILEAIQDVKVQLKRMATRVAKLEMPAAKPKGTRGRTVFFGDGHSEEEEEFELPLPVQPPNQGRTGSSRAMSRSRSLRMERGSFMSTPRTQRWAAGAAGSPA